MDWVPIVFVTFKLVVFGSCMFFAIKSHHDRAQQKKNEASRTEAPTEQPADDSN
jgi:hypothetical protein